MEGILIGGVPVRRRAGSRGGSRPRTLRGRRRGAGRGSAQVSQRALQRGFRQVGSLGSGNHFLEVQVIEDVYDHEAATAFGLHRGRVCVMIHCGSRGLGHQICSDHVRTMLAAMPGYGIDVPDRQLACAPVGSPEGRKYLASMAAAANYGRANRQAPVRVQRVTRSSGRPGGAISTSSTTCPTTSRRSRHTRSTGMLGASASIARAQPAPFHQAILICRRFFGRWGSPCSSRVRWGRPHTSCAAFPAAARSTRRVTAQAAR